MARSALGANIRSKKPPTPLAPSQAVEICTTDASPRGETVNVVTALELMSDSVRTRPGSGSAIFIRYWRVRPPAVVFVWVAFLLSPAALPPPPALFFRRAPVGSALFPGSFFFFGLFWDDL